VHIISLWEIQDLVFSIIFKVPLLYLETWIHSRNYQVFELFLYRAKNYYHSFINTHTHTHKTSLIYFHSWIQFWELSQVTIRISAKAFIMLRLLSCVVFLLMWEYCPSNGSAMCVWGKYLVNIITIVLYLIKKYQLNLHN